MTLPPKMPSILSRVRSMGGDGHETEQVIARNRSSASSKSTRRGCQPQSSAASTGSAARRFTSWRSKYGGMEVSDARKLKGLEDENRRLKKLLAESMLDVATLRVLLAKNF